MKIEICRFLNNKQEEKGRTFTLNNEYITVSQ